VRGESRIKSRAKQAEATSKQKRETNDDGKIPRGNAARVEGPRVESREQRVEKLRAESRGGHASMIALSLPRGG
jgi:hypothetical protein